MGQQASAPKITAQDRAIFQMKQQRDKLKQYQRKLNSVILRQQSLAKEALLKGDNERAKFYLKSKKQQEGVITKTYDQLDNLENLIGTIEFKLIEKDVVYGLSQGNQVLKTLNNEMSADKIDKIIDDLEDEKMKVDEVSDMLGTSSALSNSEEMEVDEELERMQRELMPQEPETPKLPEAPRQQPLPEAPTQPIEEEQEEQEEKDAPQLQAA